jgi:hypothetical protein
MKNLFIIIILTNTLCAIQLQSTSAQDSTCCSIDSVTLKNILAYKDYCKETTLNLMRIIEFNDSIYTAKLVGKDQELAYDSLVLYSQRQTIHELTPLLSENKRLKRDAKIGWGAAIVSIGTLILSIIFK